MPYRVNARDDRPEPEDPDIVAIRAEARMRRTRAAVGMAAVIAGLLASAVGLTGVHDRAELRCHRLTIQWEATDHVPPPPATYLNCHWEQFERSR